MKRILFLSRTLPQGKHIRSICKIRVRKKTKKLIRSRIHRIRMTCLEDSTERSESNPGRSLGIIKREVIGCLEDSTPNHPCSKKYSEVQPTTDLTDDTDSSQSNIAARQEHSCNSYHPCSKKDSVVQPATDLSDDTDSSSQSNIAARQVYPFNPYHPCSKLLISEW